MGNIQGHQWLAFYRSGAEEAMTDALFQYAAIPRCCDCVHQIDIEWNEQKLFRTVRHNRTACELPRPLLTTSGVLTNGDLQDMRIGGPCGYEGKLFVARKP